MVFLVGSFFPFSTWNISFHFLLGYTVAGEKSDSLREWGGLGEIEVEEGEVPVAAQVAFLLLLSKSCL